MTNQANAYRGETALIIDELTHILRPSFAALVAAEEELGPLFALVERAGNGQLRLSEMVALFWHCLHDKQGHSREAMSDAVAKLGLAACAKPLRALLEQILQGHG